MAAKTHPAVVTTAPHTPLQILEVPTPDPGENEVLIKNWWTASTPLDLHQADAGLALPGYPARLGDGFAGPVLAADASTPFKSGDLVFGFSWRNAPEKAHQTHLLTVPNLIARVPSGWETRLPELVTVPNNFVSVWHSLVVDLGIKLPWPKPEGYQPDDAEKWILIWGGASSCGQYSLQLLRHYGYTNIIATASPRNFSLVKECGANHVVNYNSKSVKTVIMAATRGKNIDLAFDCIGSLEGSVKPIASLVQTGATVAILLPVIVRDSTEDTPPIYEMDVLKATTWPDGVDVKGVRTHFYLNNEFHAKYLQPEIMPALIERGIITPNKTKIVEGATLLERAQKALDMLRRKEASGERLVWRVAEDE